MLMLFKGQLRYHEFMREMTYTEMMALRDARIKQLIEENKNNNTTTKNNEVEEIRQRLQAVNSL